VCSLPGFYAPRAVIPQRGCATGPRHFFALADNLAITEMLRGSNYFCEMKDNFSKVSQRYAQFRPQYPKEIFDYLSSIVTNHDVAWDAATGNGQVARGLSSNFKMVEATDISEKQIQHAFQADNIHYSVEPAEHTSFPNDKFDLITIGQAIHWFHFDE